MPMRPTPIELSHFVPEPLIVLFGCRPLVPYQPGWHDRPAADQHYRAPTQAARPGDHPWPRTQCPACKGQIGRPRALADGGAFVPEIDHRVYCELCGSMDPRNEANAQAQRVEASARLRHETSERQVESALHTIRRRPRLSEADRRRIWNGYKGGILAANLEITNRAKIGREFLTRIGQEPDWTLILDASGKVIGRHAS